MNVTNSEPPSANAESPERVPSKMKSGLVSLAGAIVGGLLVQGMWRLALPPFNWPAVLGWFGTPPLIVIGASAWLWKRDHRMFAGGLAAGAILWTLVVLAIVIQFARGMENFD